MRFGGQEGGGGDGGGVRGKSVHCCNAVHLSQSRLNYELRARMNTKSHGRPVSRVETKGLIQ